MAHTEAELKKMKKADLLTLAISEYEVAEDELDGMTKSELIETIDRLSRQAEEVDDDDELDDDEIDDDDEQEGTADEVDDELDDEELDDEPEPAPKKTKAKAKAKPDANDGEAKLAAKQVAALLNTDAKTLRQFLRSPASTFEAVGSGGRYEFTESDVDPIRNEFAAWVENKAKRTRSKDGDAPKKRTRKEKAVENDEVAAEVEELDDELDDELAELLDDEVLDDEVDDTEEDDELDDEDED